MNRSKYRAIPTVIDGIRFDSKKEAKRYQDLKLLERAGKIRNLVVDKKCLKYSLDANGVHICNYVADFGYVEDGKLVIEDAKGFKTPVYKLKKKLMKAIHGIEIQEV